MKVIDFPLSTRIVHYSSTHLRRQGRWNEGMVLDDPALKLEGHHSVLTRPEPRPAVERTQPNRARLFCPRRRTYTFDPLTNSEQASAGWVLPREVARTHEPTDRPDRVSGTHAPTELSMSVTQVEFQGHT